jgi:predicted transcriptional regulator
MTKPDKMHVGCYLPQRTVRRLDKLAVGIHGSRSQILRFALEAYLKKRPTFVEYLSKLAGPTNG